MKRSPFRNFVIKRTITWLVVGFGLVFMHAVTLYIDIHIPKFLRDLAGIIVGAIIVIHLIELLIILIRNIVDEIRKLVGNIKTHAPIPNPNSRKELKKIVVVNVFVLLLAYAGFLTFVQLRQSIPLYTPFSRSVEHLSEEAEEPVVKPNLIIARIILGDYKGLENNEAASNKVWATILISRLDKVANGTIDWGDGTPLGKMQIKNGLNYFGHEYKSIGLKKLKLSLKTNGQPLKMVDIQGVSTGEITAEIEIVNIPERR
ncbi:MAG: hypothetical protein ACUZ77_05105 [Candidatus Brocadiales bacterium]